MRSRTTFAFLAVVLTALGGCAALGGCGSTNSATTSSSPSTGATSTQSTQPITTLSYSLKLAAPAGTPHGSGLASVRFDASKHQVCWKFSQLKHVTVTHSQLRGSIAVIQRTPAGTPATPGVVLGFGYKSSGCVSEPVGFLQRFESDPQLYYLSLYNTLTGGVVRGHF